ncbi:MAG TPA: tRNA lysidine(34) synthetase TilS [Rhizomicrobium sp.]|nr:tRNA lysidine(34) synthetase TilS [Rhizomicrobium sp.]
MAGHDAPVAAPWAIAVSGGGDSLALMHLLAAFARARKWPLPVVLTVDHGLRKTSAADARQVVRWARAAGLKAHVLTWRGPKPKSGIEAAGREARYRLMGAWMRKRGIATLFVGHTEDDQAETFLLRLARGSGLDGLAGMRAYAPWPVAGFEGLSVARPLLDFSREEMRAYLKARSQAWLDDPMNEDGSFDRVKLRKARAALEAAGLSAARIAQAASHLARARESLEMVTEAVLARAMQVGEKGILLDPQALAAAPRELGLRALAWVLMAVSGRTYRPRFDSLERLFDALAKAGSDARATLHGCQIGRAPANFAPFSLLVRREGPRKA